MSVKMLERFFAKAPPCALFLLAALSAGAAAAVAPSPATSSVALPYGEVRGNALESVDEFLGIPFARPPVGELRFAPPEPWAGRYPGGRLDARRFGASCMQPPVAESIDFDPSIAPISEDCLYLNIYRPRRRSLLGASAAQNSARKRPVMLWIHGGSLLTGTAAMPATNATMLVAQHGVVVVTANYRLNVFGFSPVVLPGGGKALANNGLRDQREAMRWVQRHIAAFGGDPDRVTIFGASAGGLSVFAHFVSPGSAGLFHRALSQSGDITDQWGLETGLAITAAIAGDVGCAGPADLACLRNASAASLVAATFSPTRSYLPCAVIDGDFLPGPPMQLVEEGKFNKSIPFVMGWNSLDGKLFSYPGVRYPSSHSTILSQDAARCVFRQMANTEEADTLMDVYPPRRTFGVFDNRGLIADVITDLVMACPNKRAAAALAAHGASVWVYSFRRDPSCSPLRMPGPVHTSELGYVFGNQDEMARIHNPSNCSVAPQDRALALAIGGLWAAFAESGAPPPTWPRYSGESGGALKLDLSLLDTPSIETGLRTAHCRALRAAGLRAVDAPARVMLPLAQCQSHRRLAAQRVPPILV